MPTDKEYALLLKRSLATANKKSVTQRHPSHTDTSDPDLDELSSSNRPRSIQSSSDALKLQHTLGNRAVARMIQSEQIKRGTAPAAMIARLAVIQREDDDDDDDDGGEGDDELDNESNIESTSDQISQTDGLNDEVEGTDDDTDVPSEVEPTPMTRNQRKRANIEAKIAALETARKGLLIGHGVVMLPFTLIDLLSGIGKKRKFKSKKNKLGDVMRGRLGMVAMLGGVNMHTKNFQKAKLTMGPKLGHWRPFSVSNAPWNFLLWISRILGYQIKKLEQKKKKYGTG